MQSPLFGNGRFASLGAGLRAVALTAHARNAVAAASIAAVGSVAYVRSWKEPPPKAPSDRWALTHERRLTSSSAQCILLELNMECLTSSHLALGELPGHVCLLQPGRGGGQLAAAVCPDGVRARHAQPRLACLQHPANICQVISLSPQHAL